LPNVALVNRGVKKCGDYPTHAVAAWERFLQVLIQSVAVILIVSAFRIEVKYWAKKQKERLMTNLCGRRVRDLPTGCEK